MSALSQAHPGSLWQAFVREVHVSPHAYPLSQTLQHCDFGMQFLATACGGADVALVITEANVKSRMRRMLHQITSHPDRHTPPTHALPL